jgi:phosphatidylglycerophosphate synthase
MLSMLLVIVCFIWCQMCVWQARINPTDPQWVNSWITALQMGAILLIFLAAVTGGEWWLRN